MSGIQNYNQLIDLIKTFDNSVGFELTSDPPIENAAIVAELSDFSITESFICFRNDKTINLCAVEYNSYSRRAVSHDYYWIGIIRLPRAFPHTYIKPESLADKVAKWFIKIDIAVPNQDSFNSRYFLASDNSEELLLNMPMSFFNYLGQFDKMLVEINKELCFFRLDEKPISREQTLSYLEMGSELLNKF